MKKHGFDRLRGAAAAAGAIGLGLLGGGSARAATATMPFTKTVSESVAGTGFSATWGVGQSATTFLDDVTTTNGDIYQSTSQRFGISFGALFTFTNASSTAFIFLYDSGINLAVDGTLFVNPNGTVDLTGTTVTSDTVTDITPGVDARVEYYFAPDRPLVRSLYTLTNTTDAPIFTSVLVMGDYSADNDTTVQATYSGDLIVDDADRWVVSDDGGVPVFPNPVATIATYGSGAAVMPVTAMTVGSPTPPSNNIDKYGYRYELTIPANDRVSIMLYSEMSATVDAATAGAADLESLAAAGLADLLVGLDNTVPILNYQGRNGEITATARIRPADDLDITVTDQDLNTMDEVETVDVTVSNDSSPEIEVITLTETGKLTGVFTGSLQTVEGPALDPGAGTMVVQIGDTLTTSYSDNPDANAGSTERTAETEVVENLPVSIGGSGGGGGGCSLATTGTDRIDPALPLLLGAAGSLLVLRSRKRSNRRQTRI